MSSKSFMLAPRTSCVVLAAVLGGCLDGAPPDEVAVEPPPIEAASTGEEAALDYAPLAAPTAAAAQEDEATHVDAPATTGRRHVIRAGTPWGEAELTVDELVDGRLLYEGDMLVGTVAELRARSTFRANLDSRYPKGIIPFTFDASWSAQDPADVATKQKVLQAMDRIAQRSPLRFVARTTEPGYLVIHQGTTLMASVGYDGTPQDLQVFHGVSVGNVMHELLHSAGVLHEHTRPDAAASVIAYPECIQTGGLGHFAINASAATGSRFDFDSIMLFDSSAYCVRDTRDADRDGNTFECGFRDAAGTDQCLSMEAIGHACASSRCTDVDRAPGRERINATAELSAGDVNGLFAMYARQLGGSENGDQFGSALAAGDFDGDGYTDLAVGLPDEAPGSEPRSGAVFVYKGTPRGLEPWTVLTQETRVVNADGTLGDALGVNKAGDRFGAALAAGDVTGDRIDDLVVGAPAKSASASVLRSGEVFVFEGHPSQGGDARHGLIASRSISAASLGYEPATDDAFGAALFVPEYPLGDVIIGAPGKARPGDPAGGMVFVGGHALSESDVGLVPAAGDRFGAALGAGYMSYSFGLAVGIPNRTVDGKPNAGAVGLFSADLTAQEVKTAPTPVANAQYGLAIAVGTTTMAGIDDLAVGAPGDGGGRVFMYGWGEHEGNGPPSLLSELSQTSLGAGDDLPGDRFGEALVIQSYGSWGQLFIGAPGERIGFNAEQSGQVVAAWMTSWQVFEGRVLTQTPDDADDGDNFGAALAVGRFEDGSYDEQHLVVGAPGEDSTITRAGALHVFRHGTEHQRVIWQSTKGSAAQ